MVKELPEWLIIEIQRRVFILLQFFLHILWALGENFPYFGQVKVKQVPLPGSDAILIVPP